MPRRVQDIVPSDRRSIRDIPLSKPKRADKIEKAKEKEREREEEIDIPVRKMPIEPVEPAPLPPHKIPSKMPRARKVSPGKKRALVLTTGILGIFIVIAVLGYIASFYFSRATFTIVPKSIPVDINGTFVAQGGTTAGAFNYELASLKGTATTTIPAKDGPVLSTKAQGKITLYNNGTSSQRLIAGTRVSSDEGKIYKLTSSVVIPAKKTSPGTVTATVQADVAGDEYNLSKAMQTNPMRIVAYKGTPKYEIIYAKPSTDITGGFQGAKKTVDPALLASTTAKLKDSLRTSLMSQIKDTLPSGYVMYDNGYYAVYGTPNVGGIEKDKAIVTVSGTVYGVMFKEKDLVAKLAQDKSKQFESFSYETEGLEELEFTIANPKDFSAEKKNSLIARIKGKITMTATIPEEEIKNKLAGISLVKTQEIFKPYGAIIEKGSGELFPPWTKVPKDHSRIKIVIQHD